MAEEEKLALADDADVISSIAHGLRFSRGKHTADEDEALAPTAAARALNHLRNSFVILRKPAKRPGSVDFR